MIDVVAENPGVTRDGFLDRLEEIEERKRLAAQREQYGCAIERGRDSVRRVAEVLESLGIVDSVRETVCGDWEDLKGKDLVVCLKSEEGREVKVGVQVKSSIERVENGKDAGRKKVDCNKWAERV